MTKYHTIFSLLVFVFILTITESLGLTLITKHHVKNNIYYFIMGCLIYGIVIPFLILKCLEYEGIGTVNLLWNIMSTITMISIGYIIFKEKVNNLHIVSLFLGILSITLLYFANKGEK